MTLDSSSVILSRHDCVDEKGLGDGTWRVLKERFQTTLLKERLRSKDTRTVVNFTRKLTRLLLKDNEPLHEYFIRAQELITRLGQLN